MFLPLEGTRRIAQFAFVIYCNTFNLSFTIRNRRNNLHTPITFVYLIKASRVVHKANETNPSQLRLPSF